jgi:hypothetical protein
MPIEASNGFDLTSRTVLNTWSVTACRLIR